MATIKDVAHHAGLSVSTVSRYLNNHPYISEEKKARIRKAMDELDYVPSAIATQLRSHKATTIGVLVSRITNPFFAYLIDAIEREAKANHYRVLIMQTYDDEHAELKMLEMLRQKLIDGLILCSVENKRETIESYREYGPIVLCNEPMAGSALPQIITDQTKITYEAIRYLLSKGYSQIAYCTGGDFSDKGHGSARNNGFKQAMAEAGLGIRADWVFKHVHTLEDGIQIGKTILAMPEADRPDALFTGSDEVASGVIQFFLSKGKRVPQDLAVMGFDNQPFSAMLAVPLTTVEQPVKALGLEATQLLLHQLRNEPYQIKRDKLQLKLVIRESA